MSTTAPRLSDRITITELLGDSYSVVVYHASTGTTRLLQGSAAAVWSLIDGTTSAEQMIVELSELFELPAATIADDVHQALETFADHGLLAVASAGSLASRTDHVATPGRPPLPRPPDT